MKRFSLSKVFGKTESVVAQEVLNQSCFRKQRGASAIEYVIIASVIALAIFFASTATGIDLQGAFEGFFTEIDSALDTSTE